MKGAVSRMPRGQYVGNFYVRVLAQDHEPAMSWMKGNSTPRAASAALIAFSPPLLSVLSDKRVCYGGDRQQRLCGGLIVGGATQQLFGPVQLAGHQAAISRPSLSAAWMRLPRTSRHSRTRSSLVTMTSAARTRSPKALRSRTDSRAGFSTLGSMTRRSRSLCLPASPRAWEPNRMIRARGAALDRRRQASSMTASSTIRAQA